MMQLQSPTTLRTFLTRRYRLMADEGVVLDWLIFKHINFDGKPFYFPLAGVIDEVGVQRYRLLTIFKNFSDMGFLSVETKGMTEARAKVTVFTLDITELKKNAPQIIYDITSEFYTAWIRMIREIETKTPRHAAPMEIPFTPREETPATDETEVPEWKQKALQQFGELVATYNGRVKEYNMKARKTGKPEKIESTFEPTDKRLYNLNALTLGGDTQHVRHAFAAFADRLFAGDITCDSPMDYFLTYDNGAFPVYRKCLDYFNAHYEKKKPKEAV